MRIISFVIMRRDTEHTAQDVVRFNGIFIDWNYDLMLTWKNTRQNTKYQHSDPISINPIYSFDMLSQHWSGQAMNKKNSHPKYIYYNEMILSRDYLGASAYFILARKIQTKGDKSQKRKDEQKRHAEIKTQAMRAVRRQRRRRRPVAL